MTIAKYTEAQKYFPQNRLFSLLFSCRYLSLSDGYESIKAWQHDCFLANVSWLASGPLRAMIIKYKYKQITIVKKITI